MTATGTITDQIEELATKLNELQSELAGIPAAIHAAQRAGHVDKWLAKQNRQEDLPAEIDATRRQLLTLQLAAALQDLPDLIEAEAASEPAVAAAQADLRELQSKTGVGRKLLGRTNSLGEEMWEPDLDAAHAHQKAIEAAAERREQALQLLADARDATGTTLHKIDELEAALLKLGEEPDIGDEPRPALTVNVTLSADSYGALADYITALPPDQRTVLAGTVPPRWIAHRLGDHVFEPKAENAERRADSSWMVTTTAGLVPGMSVRMDHENFGHQKRMDDQS